MIANIGALSARLAEGDLALEPLAERHREGLAAACAADTAIWAIYPSDWSPAGFAANFDALLHAAQRIPFAILRGSKVIGMSSYINPSAEHGSAEVGGTYLAPEARADGTNARVKRLMIDHARACGIRRIELRVDTRNARSMAAVEKLGAAREGTLRRHSVTWTGYVRDVAIYALFTDGQGDGRRTGEG